MPAAPLLDHPLLPMQKQLVVLQHGVITDVLEPLGTQAQQAPRPGGTELKGEAGDQAAFAGSGRHRVDDRQDPGKPLGGEVMPHQAWSQEAGVLAAELSPPRALFPEAAKALAIEGRQGEVDRRGVLPASDRGVVGKWNVAGIQHVLQQGQGIHRQVPEGVLHDPARVLEHRYQRQGLLARLFAGAAEDEQQSLGGGRREGPAVAASTDAAAGFRLGLGRATARAIKGPTVIRTLQFTGGVQASVGERNESVGADIGKGSPGARVPVEPEHEVLADQGEGGGAIAIEVPQKRHREPGVLPAVGGHQALKLLRAGIG